MTVIFQAVVHIQITLQKLITSLATEMRKMALIKAGYIFISTHSNPTTLECALVVCNAICTIMVGAQQIETELNLV